MSITSNEVSADLKLLADGISNCNRPLVHPASAMKLACRIPLLLMAGYLVSYGWLFLSFKVPENDFFSQVDPYFHYLGGYMAAAAAMIGFGVFVTGGFYSLSLGYLCIPEEKRKNSIVIGSLQNTLKKLFVGSVIFNSSMAGVSFIYDFLLYLAPVFFLVTIIICQQVIGAEIVRYGLGPLMKKITETK